MKFRLLNHLSLSGNEFPFEIGAILKVNGV
jgi:hypothetical protein